ncbi:lysine-specific demethylase JMJ705-like isoform X1 [Phoenix dactylifera]|uniref:Lysine-specific demethylase JMJ705-like isoform X1 n=1 Tax=Phoenix dactylifera TaxID=42345 RepID=A0A8B7CIN7_PHODC|nr:lysine-specific demethylase JMJ705-like isoform X1 [Phoenix dactylifera]
MAAAAAGAAASSVDPTLLLLPPPPPPGPTEVPQWLKSLPLAPEYHPTLAEFQDPIAYILKIEKEASSFGICKIVPPLPAPPRKTTFANLNRSFAAREPNPKKPPTFATRQQQIGFCPRRPRPVQKPVWQSGEHYTLQQFETKAKQFERAYLKKAKKAAASFLSPLEIETLFWKACADKPFSVEYANDMPGSGFAPLGAARRWRGVEEEEEAANVGETAWNMRGVSRAKGSLLRFMKEEIPGVTSPMVYVAMMFSWFAWHVEDHELHSLNYLHMGAGKTWYGVPRDAALAFEEVVRLHGYGGEVNRLVTFALLGEKTTVMTPEVLTGAGIPCCRLVQNAGEFVVTFPGSYHTGFSLGFNCGEAANIATPGWLRVAKEAAIRRASINYPPMVSHFQLLYELALSLCTRMPRGGRSEPRSSRLKDKMKGDGEEMVKNIFVQNVIQNNHLLSFLLDKGSSCIVLPQNAPDSPLCSNSLVRLKAKPRLSVGLCSHEEAMEASRLLPSDDITPGWNAGIRNMSGLCSLKGNSVSVWQGKMISSATCSKFGTADFYSSSSDSQNVEGEKEGTLQGDGLLDQGLLSCVTCGILSFACVAVIQPREAAAKYLMSADCGILSGHINGSGEVSGINKDTSRKIDGSNLVSGSGQIGRHTEDAGDDYWVHCSTYSGQVSEQSFEVFSDNTGQRGISALDLLASAYGDTSDTEEEVLHEKSACTDKNDTKGSPSSCKPIEHPNFGVELQKLCSSKDSQKEIDLSLVGADCQNRTFAQNSHNDGGSDDPSSLTNVSAGEKCQLKLEFCGSNESENAKSAGTDSLDDNRKITTSSSSIKSMEEPMDFSYREVEDGCHATETADNHENNMKMGNPSFGSEDHAIQPDFCCDLSESTKRTAITTQSINVDTGMMNSGIPAMRRCDKDSSRMHVFCLEHAVEVEKQIQPAGGIDIMLFCHPDYPKIEAEAKLLAEELGIHYTWKDVHFKEATEEEQERFRAALEDEEAIPVNSDWAVKLGINLYYSASLSKSPLYSKQMPYNSVIYKAFGCNSPGNSPVKPKTSGRRAGRQKKIVVAGRWCGKVWMSNQVHPYLAHRNEAQEHDHVEQLYSQGIGQKPKVKTHTKDAPSERNPPASDGTSARKSGKKRKKPLRKASKKKPRRAQIDKSEATDDVPETSSSPCGRVLRSSHSKHAEIANRKKFNRKDEAEGGPSTRLRKRTSKATEEVKTKSASRKQVRQRKAKKAQVTNLVTKDEDGEYVCDIEGCSMSFSTKQDLSLHKRDICPVKGCGKKFFSHKYLVQHRKVHMDDRPLECPWKGCKMTFKWAWARTEHIRVHTGDRPYVCREPGCGQTFRFVSDFSRHKRKTGHSIKKGRR